MAATLVDGIEVFDPRYVDYPTDVEPNDPDDALAGEPITPIWPDRRRDDLYANARLSYDRRSDTLHMRFPGDHRPTFNHHVKGGSYLLLDLQTNEVVGFEIETFLLKAVPECPDLVLALDVAELRGITPDEVLAEKAKALSLWTVVTMTARMLLRSHFKSLSRRRRHPGHAKQDVVKDYYLNGCGCAA